MTHTDTEMQDAAASTAQSKVGAARLVRASVAAVTILAAAGTGYLASRLWPLPTRPQPMVSLASTVSLEARVPEARETQPGAALAKVPDVTAPAAPSQPAARAEPEGVAAQPKAEDAAASPVLPAPAVASPAPTPTEQAKADGGEAPKFGEKEPGKARADPPRRDLAAAKLYRAARHQRSGAATSKVAQSPPANAGVRNNPVLREFMGNPATRF
jgi:hypothetical protein